MSDSSDDSELSCLQRAAEFMRRVRLAQAATGRGLRGGGRVYVPRARREAISEAVSGSALVAAVKESALADLPVDVLAERFEEMCRLRCIDVDAALRPSIGKLLAAELWVNHTTLNLPAEQLISTTMYQGAIGPELIKKFERFQKRPSIFEVAVTGHPSDPRAFLHKVGKQIDALTQEPEFERLRETPGVFTKAVVEHSADPRAFLRKATRRNGGWAGRGAERETDTTPGQQRD